MYAYTFMYIKYINKLPERKGKELSTPDVLRERWYRTEADRRLHKQLRSHIINEVTNVHIPSEYFFK